MLKKIITNPFFIFPFITCIFFWPLSLQFFTLKNDALTYYYPIRTLISDALNNGELPLWTAFINMGYPLHADLQSGAWNPIIWIFSFLTHYSLAAFQYELLFYISFAGIGFYFLCREMGFNKKVAITFAIAYQFSGFIIDSVQFFNCISAACYIPFIFLFFRKLILQKQKKDAAALAIFLYLLFTGGYPSFFIITCYLLFTYFIFSFIQEENKRNFTKQFLPIALLTAILFVVLSLPAILSFINHLPTIERGKALSLSTVLENSMNPASTLSLLSPFGTTSNTTWLNSSILMRNVYIGIIPLLFLIYSFFNKQLSANKELKFFFYMALVLLGIAWGEYFFLRQITYYTLPLMDSFRHPGLFRLFTIHFFLLITAASFDNWSNTKALQSTILKNILIFLSGIVILIAIICILFMKDFSILARMRGNDFKTILSALYFNERYLVQFPFVILILALSFWGIYKKKNTQFFCFIVIADLFFATQLNMPVTVIGAKKFNEIENLFNRNPVTFPLPGMASIEENSINSFDLKNVTGSRIPFIKKIGRNDYFITPGNLIIQDSFYNSYIKNIVFKNPPLYFADHLVKLNSNTTITVNKIAFTMNPSLLSDINTKDSTESVLIKELSANSMHAKVYKKNAGLLVYQQNNYPGWKAIVDGHPTNIVSVNISFMGIQVPAGHHSIQFIFYPANIVLTWYISIITLFGLLSIFCFIAFSRYQSKKPPLENASI